jgi:hypothetical protein
MLFLVYLSSADTLFSPAELHDLLTHIRAKNARLGITGVLLYKDGNFMQLLEGEPDVVRALYTTIQRDPRHHGVLILLQGPLAERQYPDWSMGFRDVNAAEVQSMPSYSEFLNTPLTGEEFASNPSRCQKLLLTFKKYM